jgi:hypothetical protein
VARKVADEITGLIATDSNQDETQIAGSGQRERTLIRLNVSKRQQCSVILKIQVDGEFVLIERALVV